MDEGFKTTSLPDKQRVGGNRIVQYCEVGCTHQLIWWSHILTRENSDKRWQRRRLFLSTTSTALPRVLSWRLDYNE
ncbi:MAG: hypothetical protein R3352_02665 [Salinisphaeraceae bacterium]|nr:hypothetical protein [Salinisphaeraceae bacterium]